MTRPRLSICIATYNRAELLRETLTHLRDVCDDDVEIVISDNGSPDHTQDVIKSFAGRFPYFRAIRQPMNRGALSNFAAATSLARGKYLYPFSDDDEIYMQGLQNAISIMEERPKIVAVFGRHEEWIRSTGQVFPHKAVPKRMDFAQGSNIEIINKFSFLWHPVCRTDIFQRFSSFNKTSNRILGARRFALETRRYFSHPGPLLQARSHGAARGIYIVRRLVSRHAARRFRSFFRPDGTALSAGIIGRLALQPHDTVSTSQGVRFSRDEARASYSPALHAQKPGLWLGYERGRGVVGKGVDGRNAG